MRLNSPCAGSRSPPPHRRLLAAEARATLRFETAPGRQMQIDFGEARAPIVKRYYLSVNAETADFEALGTCGSAPPPKASVAGRKES